VSPELERLLEALYEQENSEPGERAQRRAEFRRLLDEALGRRPGLSSRQLIEALRPRYVELLRARRKPPTLPPKA